MASSPFQLSLFFIFYLSIPPSAVSNLHKTRSLLRSTTHLPPLSTSPTLNSTSPTVYFEVTKPFADLPTTHPPCSRRIPRHDFGYTYGKPPVIANYTPPSHCPFRAFSKIVLEFKATCRGRQFDRILGVWLNGVELLRSCTAEPIANGIFWAVEKDVTRYRSLLVKNETQILAVYLGNIVDKIYTGVYHVDLIFHFYPTQEGSRRNLQTSVSGYGSCADLIIPISRNPPLNDGLWLEIVNSADPAYKEFKIPRNVYRAVLEVYVSFHENDEFWYGNLPNDYITANNLSAAGNGPFREVVISLDGDVVGAVWPFTVVYTGGINPLLWRPITGIGSFNLPTYDIEITPFLASLLDGKPHKLGFSVTNALNVWYIDANLHLWLDSENERVEGKLSELRSGFAILSISDLNGLNGKFITKANRSIASTGWIKSSHGNITSNTIQEFSYGNTIFIDKDGNLQIIDQLIQVHNHVYAKKLSTKVQWAEESFKNFPFYLYSEDIDQGNNTYLTISNVTMGYEEKRSKGSIGLRLRSFESELKNKQDGQGVMVVKDNLVTSGSGSTQQVYRYIGSDQCYFRNISSSNYAILVDKIETLCRQKVIQVLGTENEINRLLLTD